ncbi:hypothetical protein ACFY1U_43980 [Streptomyces sp. NPDC001351]
MPVGQCWARHDDVHCADGWGRLGPHLAQEITALLATKPTTATKPAA